MTNNQLHVTIEENVLESIADRAAIHVMELADKLDAHPVTVDRACARLHTAGDIHPSGYGCYTLTTKGQQRLDNKTE